MVPFLMTHIPDFKVTPLFSCTVTIEY